MARRTRSVAAVTAVLMASTAGAVSAAPPTERPVPPTAREAADIQPRDLVIDERGLGYLRRASGQLVPYGHAIAAEKRPVEPRAPGGRPGRPGGGGTTDDGTVTLGQWEGGQVATSAGRILFQMADGWYVCSGTAVTDDTIGRSIVLTAAHCIYDDVAKAFATQALFIPNQDDGGSDGTDTDCRNDLHGCWILDHGVVDENWTNRTFPANIAWDYGFYVVSDTGAWSTNDSYASPGNRALDGLGTLDIDVTATINDTAHALGYSYDVDPEFVYCAEPLATEATYDGYWLGQCRMSGGASGGPWVQPMDEGTGSGPVFSVNSWGYSFQPGMGGPVLAGSSAIDLFAAAQASTLGSAGEVVPAGTPSNNPPTASFTYDCTDLACSFDATGSFDTDGEIAAHDWVLGDGNAGSGPTTNHTYADAGSYYVTLTVTDNDGAPTEITQNIQVTSPGPDPAPSGDVILTGSSVDNGRTWQAIVTVTGPAGTYSGAWSTGASDTCTITSEVGDCLVSRSQRKNVASVTFTLDGSSVQSVTVAKP